MSCLGHYFLLLSEGRHLHMLSHNIDKFSEEFAIPSVTFNNGLCTAYLHGSLMLLLFKGIA